MSANVPRHLAIILDGNGRWAERRGLPRSFGHRRGANALLHIIPCVRDAGVSALSVFCFSTENWNRPATEIHTLMRLLGIMLRRHRRQLSKQKMRFHWLGRSDGLPERDVQTLREMEEETRHWNDFHLSLAINYGGRDDTLRAVQKLQMKADTIDANTLQWSDIAAHMDTAHLPDVDLLIRTGGERRLSNFLLLQCAYAEMYFTDCLWPDFDAKELQIALNAYSLRHRRYGTIDRPE